MALRVVLAVLLAASVPFWIWQAARADDVIARALFVGLILASTVSAIGHAVVAFTIPRGFRVRPKSYGILTCERDGVAVDLSYEWMGGPTALAIELPARARLPFEPEALKVDLRAYYWSLGIEVELRTRGQAVLHPGL